MIKENHELVEGVKKVIELFQIKRSSDNKKGETLLILTDLGVDNKIRKALYQVGKEIAGDDAHIITTPEPQHPAQDFGGYIGEKIKCADAILLATSKSKTHSKEIAELFTQDKKYDKLWNYRMKKRESLFPSNSRIISITTTTKDILTEGAAQENFEEMKNRIGKLEKILEGVKKFHITSDIGTDITVNLKKFGKEYGYVTLPGQGSNFPAGEYGSAVHLKDTNGILVIDGVSTNIGIVDKPIKIKIKEGKAIEIRGGSSARRLKDMLNKANTEYFNKNPNGTSDSYKLAECSLGMNSKAFRYKNNKRLPPPTSLEAEKGLGTMHFALGRNTVLGVKKEDPDYNNVPIHIDNVIMEPTLVVEKESGERIRIIEKGKYLY